MSKVLNFSATFAAVAVALLFGYPTIASLLGLVGCMIGVILEFAERKAPEEIPEGANPKIETTTGTLVVVLASSTDPATSGVSKTKLATDLSNLSQLFRTLVGKFGGQYIEVSATRFSALFRDLNHADDATLALRDFFRQAAENIAKQGTPFEIRGAAHAGQFFILQARGHQSVFGEQLLFCEALAERAEALKINFGPTFPAFLSHDFRDSSIFHLKAMKMNVATETVDVHEFSPFYDPEEKTIFRNAMDRIRTLAKTFRTEVRFPVPAGHISIRVENEVSGHLDDFSLRGARVTLDRLYAAGSLLLLTIEHEDFIDRPVRAQVVWSTQEGGLFAHGLKLTEEFATHFEQLKRTFSKLTDAA
jgi:hypothetical protein